MAAKNSFFSAYPTLDSLPRQRYGSLRLPHLEATAAGRLRVDGTLFFCPNFKAMASLHITDSDVACWSLLAMISAYEFWRPRHAAARRLALVGATFFGPRFAFEVHRFDFCALLPPSSSAPPIAADDFPLAMEFG